MLKFGRIKKASESVLSEAFFIESSQSTCFDIARHDWQFLAAFYIVLAVLLRQNKDTNDEIKMSINSFSRSNRRSSMKST